MLRRIAVPFTLALLALIILIQPGSAEPDNWFPVGPGIDYQKFIIPGPNNVFVARMDRNNPNLIVESSIAQGKISGGTETVSGMANRYDQSINFWGDPNAGTRQQSWGYRNRVVVAINGFFYGGSEEPPGVPWSGQVHSGWYAKRFDPWGDGFVWNADREAYLGVCAYHRGSKNVVWKPVLAGEPTKVEISEVNVPRGSDELILYTPQWDVNTKTGSNSSSVEILVEMSAAALIRPYPDYAEGQVVQIRDGLGSTPIPFDHVVLSAKGGPKDELLNDLGLEVGDIIRISQEISKHPSVCNESWQSWKDTYASIGGYPILLRDGVVPDFSGVGGAFVRNPRTAIAFNDDYVYFVVVDGRNPGTSIGMNYPELATFLKDVLDAKWGINQDGGGSSTLVINGQVMNNTYCNHTDCRTTNDTPEGDGMGDGGEELPPNIPDLLPEGTSYQVFIPDVKRNHRVIQRLVANGMMMVVVEPQQQSTAFNIGQAISTVGESKIYLGPGENFGVLTSISDGSLGVIEDHANDLEGVQAKGTHWWKVGIGTTSGWMAQEDLSAFTWVSESRYLSMPQSFEGGLLIE